MHEGTRYQKDSKYKWKQKTFNLVNIQTANGVSINS